MTNSKILIPLNEVIEVLQEKVENQTRSAELHPNPDVREKAKIRRETYISAIHTIKYTFGRE